MYINKYALFLLVLFICVQQAFKNRFDLVEYIYERHRPYRPELHAKIGRTERLTFLTFCHHDEKWSAHGGRSVFLRFKRLRFPYNKNLSFSSHSHSFLVIFSLTYGTYLYSVRYCTYTLVHKSHIRIYSFRSVTNY